MRQVFFPAMFLLVFLSISCKKDAATPQAATPSQSNECTTCIIFLTASTSDGSFGGAAAADAICNADSNKPAGGSTYKAMLADGTNRRACTTDNCTTGGAAEHIDWVLKPNTIYTTSNGTTIGTTDSNGLLSYSISTAIGSAGEYAWTGISFERDFMSSGYRNRWKNSNTNCNSWTDNTNTTAGEIGQGEQVDYRYIDGGNSTCINSRKFFCVEQ